MRMKNSQLKKIMKKMSIRQILQGQQARFQQEHFYLIIIIKIKKYLNTFRKVNKLNLISKTLKCIMLTLIIRILMKEMIYLKVN